MTEEHSTSTIERAVQDGLKSSLVGICSNLALAGFKCVAGFLGHSFALIADGIESLSDVVSSTVVFFGLKFAIKPPDKEHPYGHGKAEPIAAVMVSLALIVAAIVIGIESIKRIQELHPLPSPTLCGCCSLLSVSRYFFLDMSLVWERVWRAPL
jgi:cation diffusion facilitator family transporter